MTSSYTQKPNANKQYAYKRRIITLFCTFFVIKKMCTSIFHILLIYPSSFLNKIVFLKDFE